MQGRLASDRIFNGVKKKGKKNEEYISKTFVDDIASIQRIIHAFDVIMLSYRLIETELDFT